MYCVDEIASITARSTSSLIEAYWRLRSTNWIGSLTAGSVPGLRGRAGIAPAAGLALVRAAEERERGAQQDQQVGLPVAVADVPEVELDPVGPRQRRTAVDLRPPGDAGLDVEPVELPLVVALHLVAERRPRADHRHVAPHDIPQLRQLVERQAAQGAAGPRDPLVAPIHGEAGAEPLGADDHRAELQQLEVGAVL